MSFSLHVVVYSPLVMTFFKSSPTVHRKSVVLPSKYCSILNASPHLSIDTNFTLFGGGASAGVE